MDQLEFSGRVAIVTGAGRGLGQSHARLLARRGARVIVNDVGAELDGAGTDTGPAEETVAEIVGAGGVAIASFGDVTKPEYADSLVKEALDEFGRVDIIVCNAGVLTVNDVVATVDVSDLDRHFSVHLVGSFNVTRAAWSHMVSQRFGRVVMTSSTAILGAPSLISYGIGKAAVLGLARNLALAGVDLGIKVNTVWPAAATRMASAFASAARVDNTQGASALKVAEQVSPLVAFLAHETCPVTGEIYAAMAGRVARIFVAESRGYFNPSLSPEDVRDNWAIVNDESEYRVLGFSRDFFDHTDEIVRAETRET